MGCLSTSYFLYSIHPVFLSFHLWLVHFYYKLFLLKTIFPPTSQQSRVYLGYLRGRSSTPKTPSLPPPPPPAKTKYCYHYTTVFLVTISEKSSRRDEVSAHEVSIPCLRTLYDNIVSQNAPDCISADIHFKKISRGGGGRLGSSGLLPNTINPRQNPEQLRNPTFLPLCHTSCKLHPSPPPPPDSWVPTPLPRPLIYNTCKGAIN